MLKIQNSLPPSRERKEKLNYYTHSVSIQTGWMTDPDVGTHPARVSRPADAKFDKKNISILYCTFFLSILLFIFSEE